MKAKLMAILGAFVLVLCGGCFMTFGATVSANETPEEAYIYTLTQSNNKFTIKVQHPGEEQTLLLSDANFDEVMGIIDLDRFNSISAEFNDAIINFVNVQMRDNYLSLKNGNYTLSGSLTGFGNSTYGLIYVNGANVTFKDAKFTNNGLSYLVKNEGDGDLVFQSGTFTSNDTTILATNGNNLTIQQDTSKKIQITSKTNSAVVATDANVVIGDCAIDATGDYAVKVTDSTLELKNSPSLKGKVAGISVDENFFDAKNYKGSKITVAFSCDSITSKTIAITNGSVSDFEMVTEGFTFRQGEGDLIDHILIYNTSKLIYKNDKNHDLMITPPIDNGNYIKGTHAKFKEISDAVLKPLTSYKYKFSGWSVKENPQVTDQISGDEIVFDQEKDIVLYPVWQAKPFKITYQNIAESEPIKIHGEDFVRTMPEEYNVDQTVKFPDLQKTYYNFSGWKINGVGVAQKNLKLDDSVYGDIVLTAVWQLKEFDIIYNGLEQSVIQKLGLKTHYNITDKAIYVNINKFLVDGYSCYGVFFDKNKTLPVDVDEEIHFKLDEQTQNSQEFLAHNTLADKITLYVDLQKYHNGTGIGTKNSPFIIEKANQFSTFVTGEKTSHKLYVKLKNDLTLEENLQHKYTGFKNITFDGNDKTLTVSKLYQADNVFAVFPFIKDSTIKNLKIVSAEPIIMQVNDNALISGAFGKLVGCTVENVVVDVDLKISCTNTYATIKAGGVAVNVENTTINNAKNLGNITVNVSAPTGSVNVYGAGIVGGEAQNSKILNCQSGGDLVVTLDETTYETRAYLSGLANLGANNKVFNCLADCDITYSQSSNNVAFIGGAVLALGNGNVVKNIVSLGTIVGETNFVDKKDFVGATPSFATTASLWKKSDLTDENLLTMNNLRSQYSAEVGNEDLNQWFFTTDGKVSFDPLWKVTFKSNEIAKDQTKYLTDITKGGDTIFFFDFNTYKFCNWEDQDGVAIDWNNIDQSVLTVYGHYDLWSDVILKEQIFACAAAGLILLGVLFIMFLFDKKKKVKFVLDGKVVGKIKVARTKRFAVPKELANTMWFFDLDGKKPFTNQRMKFHPIKLFAFTGEKQEKFEAYWNEQARLKQEAIEKAKQEKLQKQRKKEEKALALKQQKEARKNKKSNRGDQPSNITVIKKEIKLINDNNDKKE